MAYRSLIIALALFSHYDCGEKPDSGAGSTGGSGECTIVRTFQPQGELGYINYIAQQDQLQQLDVQINDYATTCGSENPPPSYSALNYWHGVGFSVSTAGQPLPLTVSFPGTSGGPSFVSCAFGDGVGSGAPTNACFNGGSWQCASGSTVTIESASATSASGSYALIINDGTDAPFNVSGSFSISGSCQGI